MYKGPETEVSVISPKRGHLLFYQIYRLRGWHLRPMRNWAGWGWVVALVGPSLPLLSYISWGTFIRAFLCEPIGSLPPYPKRLVKIQSGFFFFELCSPISCLILANMFRLRFVVWGQPSSSGRTLSLKHCKTTVEFCVGFSSLPFFLHSLLFLTRGYVFHLY